MLTPPWEHCRPGQRVKLTPELFAWIIENADEPDLRIHEDEGFAFDADDESKVCVMFNGSIGIAVPCELVEVEP